LEQDQKGSGIEMKVIEMTLWTKDTPPSSPTITQ
jgi:hypothetical protein